MIQLSTFQLRSVGGRAPHPVPRAEDKECVTFNEPAVHGVKDGHHNCGGFFRAQIQQVEANGIPLQPLARYDGPGGEVLEFIPRLPRAILKRGP